jgi:hypothetical protein
VKARLEARRLAGFGFGIKVCHVCLFTFALPYPESETLAPERLGPKIGMILAVWRNLTIPSLVRLDWLNVAMYICAAMK